jgi:TolB protein
MGKKLILFVLLLAATRSGAFGQTDIYLTTERSGRGKIPIVVRDIEAEDRASRESALYIARVLRKDLAYSGYFDPVAFEPGSDTLAAGLTAAAIFEGTIGVEGDRFSLEVALLDFLSRETIFSKRYVFGGKARRRVAHYICDEITYFLIGERGVATTRLLFCRRDGETKDLFVVDYDGFGERQLTKGELTVSPLWLDWKRLLYTSYKRGNPDCYMIDFSEGKKTLLSYRKGLNLPGDYLSGRDQVVMTLSIKGNSEIYILDTSGNIVQRLTRNRAIDCSPSWAPNGNEIAFVSDRTGTPQIYIMDRFGGNVRRLSVGSYNTSPAWSPTGEMIAYASREGGFYRLKLATPDGLANEILFDDFLSYEDPVWAPNGKHVAASVKYGGEPWIVIIDSETGEKRRLVRGESPAWSPIEPRAPGD